MSKYSRLGKNTLLVFVGNIGGKVLIFLMLPLYTRWLTVSDFGVTDMIMTYASLLFGIVTLSISESVFIFPKDKPADVQGKYFTSGFIFTLLCFFVFAIFICIYTFFFKKTDTTVFSEFVWLIYLLMFAMFLQNYFQQFTRCIDKMKIYSLSGLVLSVGIIVCSFIFIPKWGIYGYVFAMAMAYILTAFFSLCFSGSIKYLSIKSINLGYYNEMLRYAIPLIPNGIMFWLIASLNRPLLEQKLGLDAVGIFAVAYKFPIVLSTLFNVFLLSWHISVLEEFNKKEYTVFFNKMCRLVFFCLCVIFCIISMSNKLIITLLVTNDFFEAWKYISLLTLGGLISCFSAFIGGNFLAIKKSKYFLYSSAVGASFSLILNVVLIPLFGIYGAIISLVISYFLMLTVRVYYVEKQVKIDCKRKYITMLLLMCCISIIANMDETIYKYIIFIFLLSGLLYINKDLKENLVLLNLKINKYLKERFL